MAHYDFREFLCALEQKGLLLHVTCEVDRIGELSQVMRWVYRGFPEEERFAVIFDNVKGFDIPVVVGAIGGSYKTYATGLGLDTSLSKPEVMQGIKRKWIEAMDHQILPIEVANPPCQEIVLRGNDINIHRLPIPVWTLEKDKGWDKGYGFMTSPYVITRDPETRIQNMGTYRGMTMAAPDEITIGTPPYQHIGIHWSKYNSKNERMPIAVAIAAHPAVGMASVTKIPYG
ncbi:MAG: UbiD family decarboxylase, partial [bacterium]|nr:UbiD family decarboxylase [bacterium]